MLVWLQSLRASLSHHYLLPVNIIKLPPVPFVTKTYIVTHFSSQVRILELFIVSTVIK